MGFFTHSNLEKSNNINDEHTSEVHYDYQQKMKLPILLKKHDKDNNNTHYSDGSGLWTNGFK